MIVPSSAYQSIAINRNNNFDFLRMLFALFVLITHSFMFTGISDCDWLCQITNGQTYFTDIGVKGFFIISGYLVFQSMMRSRNASEYLWRRVLRIYPALIVVLLLIVLLAPFVYESNVPYWKNKSVWTYIPSNLSLYIKQTIIRGVFENNPHSAIINGSLWTIAYEFFFYFILGSFMFIRNFQTLMKVAMLTLFLIPTISILAYGDTLLRYGFVLNLYQLCIFSACFFSGATLGAFQIESLPWRVRKLLLLISVVVLFLLFVFQYYPVAGFFILPFAVILFGSSSTAVLCRTGESIGDLSYGIYIYGCPIQQTLVYFFTPNYIALMLSSIPLALLFGFVSWHAIESQALKFKNRPWLRKRVAPALSA